MRGKLAVAAWLHALPETQICRIEVANVHTNGRGGLAYKVADFTTWLDTVGQSSGEAVMGSQLWILLEVSPEQWRVAVVAWSIGGPTERQA